MTLPSDIRAVVFDAVGTVMIPVPSAAEVYSETAWRYGVTVSPAEVATRFRVALAIEDEIDREAGWVTSEARERERWRRVVTHALPQTPPEAFDVLFAHFADPRSWRVPTGTADVLEALARHGIALGLASNYDARIRTILPGLTELRPLADRVVVSSEVGGRKPGRPFFAAVAAVMGEPPTRIAFVGDDRTNDYDGAAAAGMVPTLLDPEGRHSDLVRRVTTLTALLD